MNIEQLMKFLSIRSLSGDEGEAAMWLKDMLGTMGWDARLDTVGEGRFNVTANLNCKLLFCSHIDVVPPFIPPKRIGDIIKGRGTADAKGVIFAQINSAERLIKDGIYSQEEIGFAYVVGEEVDHIGASILSSQKFWADNVIVGEPTNNRLCKYGFGLLKIRLTTEGTAGHSAFPDSGNSAVHELVKLLSSLEQTVSEGIGGMRSTYNIGIIQGGTAANVYAPHAGATVLYRLTEESEVVLGRLSRMIHEMAPNTTYEILSRFEPMEFTVINGVKTDVARFNSDAKYFIGHTRNIFLFGPGNIRIAHGENEMISLSDVDEGVQLYYEVAKKLIDNRI